MKKNVLFVVVMALVISVIGVARTSPGWASALNLPLSVAKDVRPLMLEELGDPSQQFDSISIKETSLNYLGGICSFDVEFKKPNLRADADIEVPVEISRTIPYNPPNVLSTLLLPGCHFVHYDEEGKKIDAASSEDGKWTVCFGERPDVNLVVYYYLDSSESKVWIPLPTSHRDGLACASAWYTGEYAPANEPPIDPAIGGGGDGAQGPNFAPSSITVPSKAITVAASGAYSVGGVCTLVVEYKRPGIEDHVHVQDPHNEDPVDWDTNLPFPTEFGLLYQPGCHVLHYEEGQVVHWEQSTETDGKWEICFAARPDKDMTIYYYLGDLADFASPWIPLETTVENGKACAPAQFTAMYTPGGVDKK